LYTYDCGFYGEGCNSRVRFRKKKRRRKMWVRPPISQFHKWYIRIPKIFSTPVINFGVKMGPFPQLLWVHEEAGRLDATGDVECTTENTPERLLAARARAGKCLHLFH
jgi:hypothetical protein